jgi:hypothetical protein
MKAIAFVDDLHVSDVYNTVSHNVKNILECYIGLYSKPFVKIHDYLVNF